jgi:hypothetical protein
VPELFQRGRLVRECWNEGVKVPSSIPSSYHRENYVPQFITHSKHEFHQPLSTKTTENPDFCLSSFSNIVLIELRVLIFDSSRWENPLP